MLLGSGCFRVLSSTLLIQRKKKKFNFLFVFCQTIQAHAALHTSVHYFSDWNISFYELQVIMSLEGFVPAIAYTELEISEFSHTVLPKGVEAFCKHSLWRFLSHLIKPDIKRQRVQWQCLKAAVGSCGFLLWASQGFWGQERTRSWAQWCVCKRETCVLSR